MIVAVTVYSPAVTLPAVLNIATSPRAWPVVSAVIFAVLPLESFTLHVVRKAVPSGMSNVGITLTVPSVDASE